MIDTIYFILYYIDILVVMLLRSRCRRSRVTLLFTCLILLTALVYALLNMSTYTASHHQHLKPHGGRGQLSSVIVNNGSTSGQRPMAISSVSLARQFNTQERTESFANGELNSTEDDGQADTGMEEDGKVYSRVGNGSRAGLTMTH